MLVAMLVTMLVAILYAMTLTCLRNLLECYSLRVAMLAAIPSAMLNTIRAAMLTFLLARGVCWNAMVCM